VNPRQVELNIGRAEHLVISPEPAQRLAIHLDATPLEDRFERLGSGCHRIGPRITSPVEAFTTSVIAIILHLW
jgi:hypothetical protein